MNPPTKTKIDPTAILFAGEYASIADKLGGVHPVRIRLVPNRELLELLDLFDVGNEARMIETVVQLNTANEDESAFWLGVDAGWVDNLSDKGHEELIEINDKLNFDRAVSYAERQIARGNKMNPLKKRIAEQLLSPVKQELESWTSRATQALSSALAAKPS